MTRRNIRKRIRDLDGAGTAREWPEAVEIAGVSATSVDEDGRPVEDDMGDEDGEDGANAEGDDRDDAGPDGDEGDDEDEEFTITISVPPNDEADEAETNVAADCPTEGCPNTIAGPLDTCEACAGMPSRDWREETVDPEAVDHE